MVLDEVPLHRNTHLFSGLPWATPGTGKPNSSLSWAAGGEKSP